MNKINKRANKDDEAVLFTSRFIVFMFKSIIIHFEKNMQNILRLSKVLFERIYFMNNHKLEELIMEVDLISER
jgi:hypothetical protein